MADDERVTVAQLADYMHVSKQTVRNLIHELKDKQEIAPNREDYGKRNNGRITLTRADAKRVVNEERRKKEMFDIGNLCKHDDLAKQLQKKTRGNRGDNTASGIAARMFTNDGTLKEQLVQQERALNDGDLLGSLELNKQLQEVVDDNLRMFTKALDGKEVVSKEE